MADILLSVGMQTGSAETKEFINQLKSIVNGLNSAENIKAKVGVQIDPASISDIRKRVSEISDFMKSSLGGVKVDAAGVSEFSLQLQQLRDEMSKMAVGGGIFTEIAKENALEAYRASAQKAVAELKEAQTAIARINNEIAKGGGSAPKAYLDANSQFLREYINVASKIGDIENRIKSGSRSNISAEITKITGAIESYNKLISTLSADTRQEYGLSAIQMPKYNLESFTQSASAIKQEKDAVSSLNQELTQHSNDVTKAAEAETQKAGVSQTLAGALDTEATASDKASKASSADAGAKTEQKAAYDDAVRAVNNYYRLLSKQNNDPVARSALTLGENGWESSIRGYADLAAQLNAAKTAFDMLTSAEAKSGMTAQQQVDLQDLMTQKANDYALALGKRAAAEDAAAAKDAANEEKRAANAKAAEEKRAAAAEETARRREEASRKAEEREKQSYENTLKRAQTSLNQIQALMRNATPGSASYKALAGIESQYKEFIDGLRNAGSASSDAKIKLASLEAEFAKVKGAVGTASSSIQLFGGGLSMLYSRINYFLSLSNMIMQAVRGIKQMVETTIELDTSLTQLQIVTGVSEDAIRKYGITAAQTAQEIGGSTKDLIDSATVFARLGYTLEESNTLSKFTNMLQNVGAIDASTAQNAITAIVKAFDIDVSQIESVMDKMVTVGNNFPISVSEIAEGMNNAGSALHAAGNSFEQSVALLTSANTTVQNISKSSTGLRTIAARIRKTTVELDDLGETIEEAKYQKVLDLLTGKGVRLTENGSYRATYDILKDIAAIWNELSSMEQAGVAEQLAGTRQQNIFYSIIEQFSEAENAMAAMKESTGALEEAYAKFSDSLKGHINTLKAAFDELSQNFVDSELLKSIIDLGTGLLKIVDGVVKATDAIGGLKSVLAIVAGIIATIKIDKWIGWFRDLPSLIKSSSPAIAAFANTFKATFAMARVDGANSFRAFFTAVSSGFSEMISMASAAQIAVGSLMAVVAVGTIISSKIEQARENERKMYADTYSRAMEDAQTADNLYDLYEAYALAKDGLDDNAESKAALTTAAENLAVALGLEKDAVDALSGSYKDLTAEEINKAQDNYLVAIAAAEDEIVSTYKSLGQYDTEKYGLAFLYTDMSADPWLMSAGSAEEKADVILRAYDNAIEQQKELARKRKEAGLTFQEENWYETITAFINKFTDPVEKLKAARASYEEITGQIERITNDTVASTKKAEDALSERQRKIATIVDAFGKGFQQKISMARWLDTLDIGAIDKYVEAISRGAESVDEADKIISNANLVSEYNRLKDNSSGEEFAKVLGDISAAAEEAGMSVADFLMVYGDFDAETAQNVRNLTSLKDELAGVTAALKEYNNAIAGEHGEVASQYVTAYKKFLEDWNAGRTGSKAVQAAVELFLPEDQLRAFGYDLQKAGEYLASDFFQAIFNSENGDPGANFANYIRENLEAFKDIAEITETGDGTFIFAYSSVEDLAYATSMTEEAVVALLDSLDAYGVQVMMSAKETAELADELGLVKGRAASTSLEIQDIANKLAVSGKKSTEILQILRSLESAGYIDLSGVSDQLSDIITQAGEFYQKPEEETPTVTIDSDISGVESGVSRANELLDSIDDKHVTTYVDNVINTITAETDGTGSVYHSGGGFSGRGGKFASGTTGAPGGPTLVNELGPELISENGRAYIAGGGRPTIVDLDRGAIVLNASDTRRALRGRLFKGVSIRAAATGLSGGHGRILCPVCGSSNPSLRKYCLVCGTPLYNKSIKPVSAILDESLFTEGPGGSGGGSGGGGGGGSSDEKEKQKVDWIVIAIDRIQRAISKLQKVASSAFKRLDTRLKASKDAISEITEEIGIMQAGYERYLQEAESVGLDADLAQRVREGTIDINEYDDDTRKKIQEFQQWYEKAIDCRDAIDDLHESIAQLYLDNFNNTQKDFENRLSEIEHDANMIEKDISMAEAHGYLESTQFYEALSSNTSDRITMLQDELSSLNTMFDEAMSSGEIEEGSEAWYEMKDAIAGVEEELGDANIQLVEYAKKMREIEWSYFDYAQEKLGQITEEADFLIELMSNKELFTDNGQFTDYGLSTMGLHVVNYETAMAKADEYAAELQRIENDLASDPYNNDLIKRREELLKLQRESILSAESEKTAVRDLVEQGIQKELGALQELIDAYKDSLDSAKDLYEYQKKVTEQTSAIADLEKQLSAYQGDTSQENRARIQKLQKQLREAQTNLEETEREKSIADQKKMLDELYKEYEDQLNKRLDDIDTLMDEMITIASVNRDTIQEIATSLGSEVGYNVTEDMLTVLGDEFSGYHGMFDHVTGIHVHLAQIHSLIAAMAEASGATKAYANGGLIDYTGLAAVHGTPGNPEMVLSAADTERFLEAAALMRGAPVLGDLTKYGSVGVAGFSGTVINGLNITIPIDHVQDYNDMIAQMQRDPKFDKLINTLTLDRVTGKSQLGKYGVRI